MNVDGDWLFRIGNIEADANVESPDLVDGKLSLIISFWGYLSSPSMRTLNFEILLGDYVRTLKVTFRSHLESNF